MSSPLTSLSFFKKSDKSCTILMRLQSQHHEIGIELKDNLDDIPPTALAFLLELLEENKLNTDLQKMLQKDLGLDESKRTYAGTLLSNYFINLETVMKYVKSATITHIQEECLYADTVSNIELSPQEEDIFWENIIQKTKHDFYLPDENDFPEDAEIPRYCGCMNILQNLEVLETFLSPPQIDKIFPCIEFEIVFHENYLQDIKNENIHSIESCLDAFIYHWLEKI
ncbi:hypothetical protein AD998_09090 [bacterium 336/3]|nr:hypothetical protein AD998_09090 [bacterium 336/3]